MFSLRKLCAAAALVTAIVGVLIGFGAVPTLADGVKDPAYDIKQRLRENDPQTQAGALLDVLEWPKAPEQFLDDVKRCLQSKSPEVRFRAVRVVGKMAPSVPHAADAIRRSFNDAEPIVRSAAATAMGRFGNAAEEFADDLGDLILHDSDLNVKLSAAEALVVLDLSGVGGIPGLVGGLKNNDAPLLQIKCMMALTNIGPPARVAIGPLADLLRSDNPTIQSAAAKSIGLLAPHGFEPRLVDELRVLLRSEHTQVRLEAVMALGYFGPESGPAGSEIVRLLSDRELVVRLTAPISVAELCDRAHLPALKAGRAAETDWRVQKQLDSAIRKVERYADTQAKQPDSKVTRNP